MANSIVTNNGAMAAVRTLTSINNDMNKTQARIESGLKVNKASDDPAVFSIAQGMRADMSGLQAVQDGLAFGKSVIGVAGAAAKKISDELSSLKQTITQGQQQGLDRDAMNVQVQKAIENINKYAESATFNGVNLLKDSLGGAIKDSELSFLQDISGASVTVANQKATSKDLGLDGMSVDAGGFRLDVTGAANEDTLTVGGKTFELLDGSSPVTAGTNIGVNIQGKTGSEITEALAAKIRESGMGARTNKDGSLDVFPPAQGNVTLTLGGTGYGLTYNSANKEYTVDTAGDAQKVKALGATAWDTDPATAVQTTDYAEVDSFRDVKSSAIAAVDSAISLMGTKMANLGAATRQVEGLQDFSKSLMNSLKEGLGSLVDADLAEESAKLQSLQTRNQLAIQSLSMANQQPQALLSLFR